MNCRTLIYINIAVYVILKLLWLLLPDVPSDFEALLPWIALPSSGGKALTHPWTFITYSFVQVDFLHLLVNMLWLGWFGTILAELRGNRRLISLYCAGAAAGSAGYMMQSLLWTGSTAGCLTGASAATAAIVAAATLLSPRYRVRLLFLGEVPLAYVAPVALICFFSGAVATVAAHLGGIIAGATAAWMWRRHARAATAKMRAHLKAMARKQSLLEKARSSGYGSLTETERLELFNLTENKQSR